MRKIICLFLALLLLLGAAATVSAEKGSAKNPTRALAVVFDNSGSMYIHEKNKDLGPEQPYAWCRATYAMEAFATMMNDGDIMQIYPMHSIQVDGQTYSSKAPLTVTQKNASDIRKIYTPNPQGTPLASISEAYKGLEATTADEKWLIVLTDGSTFDSYSKEVTVKKLNEALTQCISTVNVLYLGIGPSAAIPSVSGNNIFFADKADDSNKVLEKLSAMCNMVFGRDALPNVKNKVTFDVSMSKLILFIQGSGINNVKLGNASPVASNELKHSTLGGGGQAQGKFKIDTTLQGVMLTYADLDAGEYPLTFDGTASSIVCYYEPDVDLDAQVLDAEGNPVSTKTELTAGTYTLNYRLVDKNGDPVTSKLLGKPKYKVSYTINGETKTVDADKAGSIDLDMQPNDEFDVNFEVTYLSGYTITRSSADLGWPEGGLKFLPPPAGTLKAKLDGGQTKYSLVGLPEAEKFRVTFIYNDAVCTDDQLSRIKATAKVKGGNVDCKLDRDEEGYFVTLNYHNTPLETDCGNFELHVTGVYTNEDNLQTNIALAKANFTLTDDSRTLDMAVVLDQKYYQFSKLKKGSPVTLKLSFSGEPLTEDELKRIKITTDSGIALKLEPDYKNSCYKAYFDPENPPSKGSHRIKFTATGTNEIGREQSVDRRVKVTFGTMPQWLRILLPILLFLLLALLTWLYLKQPVLPRRINSSKKDESYTVGGDLITGSKPVRYSGGGKKTGDIKVTSVNCPFDNMATQGVTLYLEAVTPRYVFNAKQKKARVVKIQPINSANVLSLQVKTLTLVPNSDPDGPPGLVNSVTGQPMKPFEISNNTHINIVSDTDENTAVYHCKLVFE